MKRILLTVLLLILSYCTYCQIDKYKIETFYLKNGMKVILCEDHNKPEVFGAISVHAGSKNDPVNATGMAHYFEHIMFKGTDKIGTINWEAEKVYQDSISMFYDKLHETENVSERTVIQKKINELTIKSADYSIPNEVDVILGSMGGTGLNAGTDYDNTVFFNSFPSNQMNKWIDVYVERFRNPVFRLFQPELETVYEEKNMYNDNPMSVFMEDALHEFFGDHPYGRPIVGLTQHLKNPQLSLLHKFFNTYYVANNMTLVLCGDFDSQTIKPVLQEKFGTLPSGKIPEQPTYKLPESKCPTIVETRQTPVKFGVIAYRTVPISNSDNDVLNICAGILNNEANTGILDKLSINHKLLVAAATQVPFKDQGLFTFIVVPKVLFQSQQDAEKYVFSSVDSIKNGHFNDELFEAVKTEYLTKELKSLEGCESIGYKLLDIDNTGKTWQEYLAGIEKIKNLKKDDIVSVANKYFNEKCFIMRSKVGKKVADKIDKPDYKPIVAKNTEAKSEFAKKIENEPVPEIKQQNISFGKDVLINRVNDNFKLYSCINPYNDIFSLKIFFNHGTIDDIYLSDAVAYVDLQGTGNMSFQTFNMSLQKLGASMSITTSDNQTVVTIEGFEKDLDKIVSLCFDKLYHPLNDESKLNNIIDDHVTELKFNKDDAATWSNAVYQYATYGDKSSFLNTPSIKEVKKYKGDDLLKVFANAINYDGYISYVGNTSINQVINVINKYMVVSKDIHKGEYKVNPEKAYNENTVFVADNKKFLQSNIYFDINGKMMNENEKALSLCFNQYFGSDMYSIVFQEIREFRSLGYTAYALYRYDKMNKKPGYLYGFLGTQSDKTIEGITEMRKLMLDLPIKPEKFDVAKKSLINSRASDYVDFREMPSQVAQWQLQGYNNDPRPAQTEMIRNTTINSIVDFYKSALGSKPIIISLSGDLERINENDLMQFGKIVHLKYNDIFKQ